ncbi:hypothetical protein PoB_005651100 [Plakobranchus ocellatus]|uniref:Uncharacterized protein n=1 Tax=Plakobranchus ocellatus TaxID=259542 RepID=A0AAV4CB98_9GAST|nr:hypothetical protein PoB_005651100 [Plakobranchus ocellatus]
MGSENASVNACKESFGSSNISKLIAIISHTQEVWCKASPQQGDLRLSGPPSGQGDGGGARTRDRRVPANLTADSITTVPPTPPHIRNNVPSR